MVVDGNGRIIISEMDKYLVSIYNLVGQKVDSFVRLATVSGSFNNSKGLAVDSSNLW